MPYDIRSIILKMVLGERALHIDLFQDRVWRDGGWEWIKESWEWRGATCRARDMSYPITWQLWTDNCVNNSYQHNKLYRENYNIGAMGFLLSCKQAYAEGIHVLYSATCIIMHSKPLLLHLPRLTPLPRLVSITSLEIVITAQEDLSSTFSLDHLGPILNNIGTYCHHLRSMCISFKVARDNRGHEILPALPLVDAFYNSMQLHSMRVELPESAWRTCIFSVWEGPLHDSETKNWMFLPVWRSLDGEQPIVQRRSQEGYPYPPLTLATLNGVNKGVKSTGYWLAEGDCGIHYVTECRCF